MMAKQPETGRGTKGLIGMVVLSVSILTSAFTIGMKIQRLADAIENARSDHEKIFKKLEEMSHQQK